MPSSLPSSFVLTASVGAEVEASPVALAARAVAVEHTARRRRGLQEQLKLLTRLLAFKFRCSIVLHFWREI